MEPEPATTTLAYGASRTFGLHADRGEVTLVLPPRPAWEVALESGSILTASTGFLVGFGAVSFYFGRQLPSDSVNLRAMLVLVGLLAIGQWVLVLLRIVSTLRSPRFAGLVTVTPDGLAVSDALPPGPPGGWWPRDELAGIRLDVVRGVVGNIRRASLQVATRSGTVTAYVFAWPGNTPTGPFVERLREALEQPPHEETDPDQARLAAGKARSAPGDLGPVGQGATAVQATGRGDPAPCAGGGADEPGTQSGTDG